MQGIALLLRIGAGCLDLAGNTLHAGRDALELVADRADPPGLDGHFAWFDDDYFTDTGIRQAEQAGEGES